MTYTITLTETQAAQLYKACTVCQNRLRQRNKYTARRFAKNMAKDGDDYDPVSYSAFCAGISLHRENRVRMLDGIKDQLAVVVPDLERLEAQLDQDNQPTN